jgi:arylsulfatase A-like enzyme
MPRPLLIVTIDRLPAWMLPAYGAGWVAMPAVTGLAARGVVFDGLIATSDEPRDSVRDLLGWLASAPRGRTAVVTDDALVSGSVVVGETTVVATDASPRQATDPATTSLARLFTTAAGVVSQRSHDVVWCHAGSLGRVWDAPEEFRDAYLDPEDPPPPSGGAVPDCVVDQSTDPDLVTGLRHVFAGQLTLLDRCVAAVLQAAGDDTTILLAGLRGMPLGLHGRLGPGPALPFSDLVRVPAILVEPRGLTAGQRCGGLVTHADLAATLAEWEEVSVTPTAATWSGRSLSGLFEAWGDVGRDRAVVTGSGGVAVVTPAWHLVRPSGDASMSQLFAKPDDYFDLCDVADRWRAVVEDLGPLAEAAAAGDLSTAWNGPLGAGGRPAE